MENIKPANLSNLVEAPIERIVPTEFNPRTINEKKPSYVALVESITAQGVVVPVHCREHPTKKNHFELLAGERRYRAAKGIGLKVIPAIHHGKLSDADAFDITFCENFAREDLTPLEEGKAVATLMLRYKGDTKAVASKLGKSTRWVLQRQAVYQKLISAWKKAIIENPLYTDWTTSHLQLIAVFPAGTQKELLEYFEDYRRYQSDGLILIKDLEKELAEWLRLLSDATWDLKAGKIAGKKPCSKCPNRSSFQPGLFDDTMDEATARKKDRCLDKSCWDEKTTAVIKATIVKVESDHGKPLLMATDQTGYYKDQELKKKFGSEPVSKQSYKASKKGAKSAVPAVVVSGPGLGELRWVAVKQDRASSGRKTSEKAGPTSLKVRRKQLDSKRWQVVLRELTKLVAKSTVDMIIAEDKTLFIVRAAAVFGTISVWGRQAEWKDTAAKGKTLDNALADLWSKITPVLAERVTYNGAITQVPDDLIKEVKTIAKHLGIDIKAMFAKQVAAITEPKSWAKLNADGTPKKAAKKTEKKAAKKKTAKKTNPKLVK